MVTIEVYASIRGRVISWLFDGDNEEQAVAKAKRDLRRKGLQYLDYILA